MTFVYRSMLSLLPLIAILLLGAGTALGQLPFAAGGLSPDAMIQTFKARIKARDEAVRAFDRQDAIAVVLVGTGSPLPSDRAQACTEIFAGGQFLLFDCGDGASRSIDAANLPIGQLDAVFLTHFHSDHMADLGEVIDRSWIQGRRHVLPVHGPAGVADVVSGFARAYDLEQGYRTAHHGPKLMPQELAGAEAKPFDVEASGNPVTVFDQKGIVVKAFAVNHPPVHPAVGYRVEFQGKVVVISGDTTSTASLAAQCRDADLLCAEVMNMAVVEQMQQANEQTGNETIAQILKDIRSYHIDVRELGDLAEQAKVKRLALTHLVPPAPKAATNLIFKGPVSQRYHGEVIIGDDGTKIILPLD